MVLGILYLKYSSRHCYPVDLTVYNAVKAFFFEEKKRCCGQYLCAWSWKIGYRDTEKSSCFQLLITARCNRRVSRYKSKYKKVGEVPYSK